MTNDTTIAEIVRSLTKAQREFLGGVRLHCIETYAPFIKLRDRGLLEGKAGRYGSHVVQTTPLGQQVRAALIKERDA